MIPDALGARTGAFLEPFFPWATIRDLRILNRYRKVLKRFKLSGFLEGIYFSKGGDYCTYSYYRIILIMYIQSAWDCNCGKWHSTMPIGLTIESKKRPAVPPFSWVLLIHPLVSSPMVGESSPFEDHFPHKNRRWFTTRRTLNPPFFSSRSKTEEASLRSKTPCALEVCSLFNWQGLTRFQWIGFGKSYGWHLHKKHRKNIEQFWLGLLVFHGFPLNRAKEPGFFHDIFAT